ncbi:hypothetical protein MBLNU457_g2610t2 [Dothideomycetes sp. NU457]
MSTSPIIAREHSDPRPFSASETLTARPSDSALQGSTRASSEVEAPKAKQADDRSADQDTDLEKQESKDKPNEQDDKDEKDEEEKKDPNLIEWDGPDDEENPMNWPEGKKWLVTCTMGIVTFSVTFASSVFSTATSATAQEFGLSQEVMILGTSLFVLGFAFGPLVWSPISELYGRKTPLFTAMFCFAIFQIPVAVAQNAYTIFICRFFGGFFASSPLAIIGGALNDFWDPVHRGIAVALFAGATFIGPVAGPIVGGFIVDSYLGWRWTEYITCIMAFFLGGIGFFIIPETFAPVLLQRRAKKIRFETRNWAIHAAADEQQIDFKHLATKYLLKPFQMLFLEPILILVTVYMGFIYGFLYLTFEAYPISFQQTRGYNAGVGSLPFISIGIGVVIGILIIVYFSKTRFQRALEENGHVVPEERLVPMCIGAVVLPIGMFWFGWTYYPSISPWPQIIAGIPIGCGVLLIFLQGLNYIIDVYKQNANSAIASNTFFRSWLGAGFPMFATAMFTNLGINWAMTVLGCLCVVLIPVPFVFFFYGHKIRKLSKYA